MCGLSALLGAWLLVMGGPTAPAKMVHAVGFQLGRGTLQSAWELLGANTLGHVFQAATVAGVVWAALNARRLAAEPARLVAASGAILAALQLGATNWTYLYTVWLFPAVALALLAEQPARRPDPRRSG